MANVVVFVTSPFAFVVTPGRVVGDGEAVVTTADVGEEVGVALADGLGEGAVVGVGDVEGDGDAEGEGDAEAVAVSVVAPPPPPPPNPPPPNPPPELPPGGVVAVADGVADALGATVAITAAVTFRLPDSVENAEVPTPLVEVTFDV